ncbi:biofilm development regulator YmgB/AriR family protein [Enterobacteriaceae bacterium H11S18]|uniref:biofilm development regulator YmgB/AriR family protein n=1 Tax=Dryocola clanedunensis TaxID=2925396 RepID=UPI0022F13D38|nr:biofilm development regulator YmgB/AriR family protein [Dryocola clanedunensis]MCT4711254.1 biofilm development regulator YmgB/AriR family protein [Dryocola clanedunensis]
MSLSSGNQQMPAELYASDAPQRMGSVVLELLMSGRTLTNKDVIATLIARLEREKDILTLDTYRQLLAFVIYRTGGGSGKVF